MRKVACITPVNVKKQLSRTNTEKGPHCEKIPSRKSLNHRMKLGLSESFGMIVEA